MILTREGTFAQQQRSFQTPLRTYEQFCAQTCSVTLGRSAPTRPRRPQPPRPPRTYDQLWPPASLMTLGPALTRSQRPQPPRPPKTYERLSAPTSSVTLGPALTRPLRPPITYKQLAPTCFLALGLALVFQGALILYLLF